MNAGWDSDGFKNGMSGMSKVTMTMDGIRETVSSGRLRVSAEEFEQIGREFGLPGYPVLMFGAQK